MKLFNRKEKAVSITHYAPDVSLTAADYTLPVSHEQRILQAERRIRDFLRNTDPDNMCESFYDPMAEKEEQLVIARLMEQVPEHRGANLSIVKKHEAEMERLTRTLQQTDALIQTFEAEINALQKFYNSHNGMEVIK